jgi:hypothetical protein
MHECLALFLKDQDNSIYPDDETANSLVRERVVSSGDPALFLPS